MIHLYSTIISLLINDIHANCGESSLINVNFNSLSPGDIVGIQRNGGGYLTIDGTSTLVVENVLYSTSIEFTVQSSGYGGSYRRFYHPTSGLYCKCYNNNCFAGVHGGGGSQTSFRFHGTGGDGISQQFKVTSGAGGNCVCADTVPDTTVVASSCSNSCNEFLFCTKTSSPTKSPTNVPTTNPTQDPSIDPTTDPTHDPTQDPTFNPTCNPTQDPSFDPTFDPTTDPTQDPSKDPTNDPTIDPTNDPTNNPTTDPTIDPTGDPTDDPTVDPTTDPTNDPTADPTIDPTFDPTNDPTTDPTHDPSMDPTIDPTNDPTTDPTTDPTLQPTSAPSLAPTSPPSLAPTLSPTYCFDSKYRHQLFGIYNDFLWADEQLVSMNCKYKLQLKKNGNLILYKKPFKIWGNWNEIWMTNTTLFNNTGESVPQLIFEHGRIKVIEHQYLNIPSWPIITLWNSSINIDNNIILTLTDNGCLQIQKYYENDIERKRNENNYIWTQCDLTTTQLPIDSTLTIDDENSNNDDDNDEYESKSNNDKLWWIWLIIIISIFILLISCYWLRKYCFMKEENQIWTTATINNGHINTVEYENENDNDNDNGKDEADQISKWINETEMMLTNNSICYGEIDIGNAKIVFGDNNIVNSSAFSQ